MDLTRLLLSMPSIKQVQADFANGRAHHAYIVEGEQSLLPQALRVLSCFALCSQGGCMQCVDCLNAMKGLHVDCLAYPTADSSTITVDNINNLVEESIMRPLVSANKVFLVDVSTPTASIEWQHKLLKSMEEPPSNVYIFLATVNAGSLLDTIRSRASAIRLDKLSISAVISYLIDNGYQPARGQVAGLLSGGSLNRAEMELHDHDSYEMAQTVLDMYANMTSTTMSLTYLSKLMTYEKKRSQLFSLMQAILRESMLSRTDKSLMILTDDSYAQQLSVISRAYNDQSVVRIISIIDQARNSVDKGTSFVGTMDNLILRILEVKHKCRT